MKKKRFFTYEKQAKSHISCEKGRDFSQLPFPHVGREEIVFPFPFSTSTLENREKNEFENKKKDEIENRKKTKSKNERKTNSKIEKKDENTEIKIRANAEKRKTNDCSKINCK